MKNKKINDPPRVFLSHATEDKDRFVLEFAGSLRAMGLDVWLDHWEIRPGDSLVEKIFEEGIGGADAVILVISSWSVDKPWVRQELDASVVARIQRGTLLIPVVLDGCEPPVSLQATLYIRVDDLDELDEPVGKVVDSVFGYTAKPELGQPPSYIRELATAFTYLSKQDRIVLSGFAEQAFSKASSMADTDAVWRRLEKRGVPREVFLESLQALEERGYLREPGIAAEIQPFFFVTWNSLGEYFESVDPEYPEKTDRIAAAIINGERFIADVTLAQLLAVPKFEVIVILHQLENRGLLRLGETASGFLVESKKASLKRAVRDSTA